MHSLLKSKTVALLAALTLLLSTILPGSLMAALSDDPVIEPIAITEPVDTEPEETEPIIMPISAPVSDITGHWSETAVTVNKNYGIMGGFPDGTFQPDASVTRAQFAAMVNRAFGFTQGTGTVNFSDVSTDDWFYHDIDVAVNMGVLSAAGYGDGRVGPNDSVTREQAFSILARVMKVEIATTSNTAFYDIDQISDWAKGSLLAMANAGYVGGWNNGIHPKEVLTRGQTAQSLWNVFGTIVDGVLNAENQTYPGNVTIRKQNTSLLNAVIKGDLYITEGVGDGDVILENVTVEGRLYVAGGGDATVTLRQVKANNVTANKPHQAGSKPLRLNVIDSEIAHIDAQGNLIISGEVESITVHEDGSVTIAADGKVATINIGSGSSVGSIIVSAGAQVNNITVDGNVENIQVEGTAGNITISENASVENLVLAENAAVQNLSINGDVEHIETGIAVNLQGEGSIGSLNIHSEGVEVSGSLTLNPENVVAPEGVNVEIGDTEYVGTGVAVVLPGEETGTTPGTTDPGNTTGTGTGSTTGTSTGSTSGGSSGGSSGESSGGSSGGSSTTYYTVTFESNGGSAVSSQSIASGNKASKPTNPTKDNYNFVGWYTDNDTFANEFNFDTAIRQKYTLYAKWTEKVPEVVTYSVTFNSNGGSSVASQTLNPGDKVTKPADPTKADSTFDGWYTDNNTFVYAFDFNTVITGNITLYAKWKTNIVITEVVVVDRTHIKVTLDADISGVTIAVSGMTVEGTPSYNDTTHTYSVALTSDLAHNTQYTVTATKADHTVGTKTFTTNFTSTVLAWNDPDITYIEKGSDGSDNPPYQLIQFNYKRIVAVDHGTFTVTMKTPASGLVTDADGNNPPAGTKLWMSETGTIQTNTAWNQWSYRNMHSVNGGEMIGDYAEAATDERAERDDLEQSNRTQLQAGAVVTITISLVDDADEDYTITMDYTITEDDVAYSHYVDPATAVAEATAALAKINAGTATLTDYVVAGATKVTSANLVAVNAAVETAKDSKQSDLVLNEVQTCIDLVVAVLNVELADESSGDAGQVTLTGTTTDMEYKINDVTPNVVCNAGNTYIAAKNGDIITVYATLSAENSDGVKKSFTVSYSNIKPATAPDQIVAISVDQGFNPGKVGLKKGSGTEEYEYAVTVAGVTDVTAATPAELKQGWTALTDAFVDTTVGMNVGDLIWFRVKENSGGNKLPASYAGSCGVQVGNIKPSPITSVTVTLAAPAIDGTVTYGQATVEGTENYTVVSSTWQGKNNGDTWAATNVPAAIITLAPKPAYEFTATTTASMFNESGTVSDVRKDGNNLVFTVTYPKLVQPAYTVEVVPVTDNTVAAGGTVGISLIVYDSNVAVDTAFTGSKNVVISGYAKAPNSEYGSFNGTALTASPAAVSVNFANGKAENIPLILYKAGSEQTISFSVTGVNTPLATGVVKITPVAGVVETLVIDQAPKPGVRSGVSAVILDTQPIIELYDAYGNLCKDGVSANASVVVAIDGATTPAGAVLGGVTTVSADDGVAEYEDLSIKPGDNNDITALKLRFTAGGKYVVSDNLPMLEQAAPSVVDKEYIFDLKTTAEKHDDVVIEINLGAGSLAAAAIANVEYNGNPLIENTDYTSTSTALIIKKEYLAATFTTIGEYDFEVTFDDDGDTVGIFTVTVEKTPVVYTVTREDVGVAASLVVRGDGVTVINQNFAILVYLPTTDEWSPLKCSSLSTASVNIQNRPLDYVSGRTYWLAIGDTAAIDYLADTIGKYKGNWAGILDNAGIDLNLKEVVESAMHSDYLFTGIIK